MTKIFLVTGANTGLGYDTVRQLASRAEVSKVYLACRSGDKAGKAIQTLTKGGIINKNKLEYLHFDASDSKASIEAEVKATLEGVQLDGLVMNAGGIGHDTTGKPSGPNGVLNMFQINVVGHIQLVSILHEEKMLKRGARVVFSGSEAARGIPFMLIGNPKMGTTRGFFVDRLEGKFPKRFDPMQTYATVKGTAALYFSAWARRHPEYIVLTVSPGATSGTEAMHAKAVPAHFRAMMPIMMPMMQCAGVFHSLETGASRYVRALLQSEDMDFPSGTFVGSRSGVSGPLADQSKLRRARHYADHATQEAAFSALSVYA